MHSVPQRQISTLEVLSGQRKQLSQLIIHALADPLSLTPRHEGNISHAAFGTPGL
jgi:hypothetical protein